jgi:predicted ATPase
LSDRVPGLVSSSYRDAESERFRLFEAVATLLTELSVAAPVLLVLDDLHWADAQSLRLLAFLAKALRHPANLRPNLLRCDRPK